jgi:hypothetical protein
MVVTLAVVTLTTRSQRRHDDMVSRLQTCHACTYSIDHSGGLVPKDNRTTKGHAAVDHAEVGVTDTAMLDPYPYFPGTGIDDLHVIADFQLLTWSFHNGCSHT